VRRAPGGSRGFTALELIISATIAGALLVASVSLTSRTSKASAAATRRNALSGRASEITDLIVRELEVASIRGEDADGNGRIGPDEDLNHDGRLDADWNVPDGGTVGDVSFNVRLHGSWTFSAPIRWRLAGDSLQRTDAKGTSEVARGVTVFTVTRSGGEVTVRVELAGRDGNGDLQTGTSQRRVYVRN
jgi:type II secretory pathway component PulJ